MIGDISNRVAGFLGLSVGDVVQMAQKAPLTYKHYKIPKKRGGGMRTIHHPSKETKSLRYLIDVFIGRRTSTTRLRNSLYQKARVATSAKR